jgi:transcriptional regulator with XRE-family HTH domain
MIENQTYRWNKDNIRSLRLRLGWSKSELAFRLHCSPDQVAKWEDGDRSIDSSTSSALEIILRQAEACSDEVQCTPAAENQCDKKALGQIDFSLVKADLDN